jgi:hypothetical protein
MVTSTAALNETASYIRDYDAILRVMDRYTEGVRSGDSSGMKPAFHENATFYGYYRGQLLAGPIQMLFDWVDGNGLTENLQSRVVSVDIHGSIAVVRMELDNLTGELAGEAGARLSDLFQHPS